MKFHGAEIPSLLALLALAAMAANDAADPLPAPQPPAAEAPPSIPDLVASLADEHFPAREAATKKLWELGDAAVPSLREAATGKDPEVAYRARDILRKLDLFILPGTDPGIISLVERYKQAATSQKSEIMDQLRAKRAYRQVLKLFAAESDQKLRANLQGAIEGLATFAAREALLAGNAAEARTMLELAPADDEGLMALAAFHRAQGTLDAEIERAKSSKAPGANAWLLALYRAGGDIPKARAAALDAGKPSIAAMMAMIEGDPLPWLEFGSTRNSSAVDLYTPLAIKRWQGRNPGTPDFSAIINRLNSRSTATRATAAGALSLLGEPSLAEPVLTKLDPMSSFASLESAERVDEALKALDLDPDKPDFTKWAAPRFAQLTREPDSSEGETAELAMMAAFLENRGLNSELEAAFDKPMTKVAEKDIDAFSSLVRLMCGRGLNRFCATGPVLRVAPAWAGDDDDNWEDILVAVFGDNDDTMAVWTLLSQVDAKATRGERFAGMFALAGIGPDPDNLRERWLARLWKHVEQADPGQRSTLLRRVSFLLGRTPDVDSRIKLFDLRAKLEPAAKDEEPKPAAEDDDPLAGDEEMVDPDQEDEIPDDAAEAGVDMLYLAAAGRWEETAKLTVKLLSAYKGRANTRADLHAYAASCLRRAGKDKEAAEHDAWVEKLALGDGVLYRRIADGYAFGEDYARSAKWWQRAVCEISPESRDIDGILEDHISLLLDDGQWEKAAATSEVLAQILSRTNHSLLTLTGQLNVRQQADLARAMCLLKTDRDRAIAMLARCHSQDPCGGMLADHFFPALRKAGLTSEHDKWFDLSWEKIQSVIKRYPGSHNSRNSAAWLAARSVRKLAAAEAEAKQALAVYPEQGAYLDTMAEIQFAKGHREEAIKWSERAIKARPTDSAVRRQLVRFRGEPFPK